ncbi:MAG: hypothetical protein VR66_14805 [Peptococcaceae bacterium BRH_c23]|nr:MAG: hypothetical protein VR66_14805 [Peptococcaceae bacterium BRH_c23]KJS90109.1 MAG: hypothetical protein JL57_03410 [Desulfosporosinus sp. BICA1-9]
MRWMMAIQPFLPSSVVRNVEEICIQRTIWGSMVMNTKFQISKNNKRTEAQPRFFLIIFKG